MTADMTFSNLYYTFSGVKAETAGHDIFKGREWMSR